MYSVHRTCTRVAAFSCGTSHVTFYQAESAVTTLVDIQNELCKDTVAHSVLHTTGAQWVCLVAENTTVVAIVKCLGLILRGDAQQVFILIN